MSTETLQESKSNTQGLIFDKKNKRSVRLKVPYYIQPTKNTCQSTCLKMMSEFLIFKGVRTEGNPTEKSIEEIQLELVEGRKEGKNAKDYLWQDNWDEWLTNHFPDLNFVTVFKKTKKAGHKYIKRSINNGYPVIASTSRKGNKGHIVLIVGYSYVGQNNKINFFVHDPFGAFHSSVNRWKEGGGGDKAKERKVRRYKNYKLLDDGSEHGPGRNILYNSNAVRRMRAKNNYGFFVYRFLAVE